jgi:hypothetical protein
VRKRLIAGVPARARRALGLLAALAAALVMAAVAAADAVVRTSGSSLVVEVQSRSGPDGNHGVIVEPFDRGDPIGSRVRQQALGNPSISSSDADCDHNPVFNDVVCGVPAEVVNVTMGDGDDRVQLREVVPSGEFGCVDFQPTWSFTVELGSGNDVLTASLSPNNPCAAGQSFLGHRRASLTARGGSGNDELNGTSLGSTLEGGFGNDSLFGTNRGDDTLRGGPGADFLSGGGSTTAGDFDTATYSEISSVPLSLTLDGQANDAGADNIAHSVERVIGGGAGDTINGNELPNTLVGGSGVDSINGRGGADVLNGGPDADELTGGEGVDRFSGEGGNDFIQSRDGVFEIISCGEGIVDSVIGDLADFFTGTSIIRQRNRNGRDCESLDVFAVDDGPPARVVGRYLSVAGGAAPVTVACPRNARVACRGTVSARLGSIHGRLVGRVRYSARLGGRTTVSVRVGNRRAGTRLALETMEQGVSKKGPRSASRLVFVR